VLVLAILYADTTQLGGRGGVRYNPAVMPSCRVTLAVMLYLTLDLATPMLPGVVQFVGLTLEVVEGCRTRSWKPPARAMPARRFPPAAPQREPVVREVRRIGPTSPVTVVLLRSPFELSSPASPASEDG